MMIFLARRMLRFSRFFFFFSPVIVSWCPFLMSNDHRSAGKRGINLHFSASFQRSYKQLKLAKWSSSPPRFFRGWALVPPSGGIRLSHWLRQRKETKHRRYDWFKTLVVWFPCFIGRHHVVRHKTGNPLIWKVAAFTRKRKKSTFVLKTTLTVKYVILGSLSS